MNKFPKKILLIILILLFVGVAPRFLFLDTTQKTITEQLSKQLGSQVTVEKMHWVWLPLPHFFFTNTHIKNEYSEFSVPKMRIYPNWRIIFNTELLLGSIHLQNPEILINEKAFQTGKSSKITLPELNVFIKNGALKIAADENYQDILPKDIFIFSNIDGTLKMVQQKARLALQATSPFSRSINLFGNFNVSNNKYQFFLDLQNIKLHKYLDNLLQGHLIPVESTARLAGSITGTGVQNIEASLHGTLPSILVRRENRETILSPGFSDFTLQKSGPIFRLTINELEMKEPGVKLSGYIEKKPSAIEIGAQPHRLTADPHWILDLTGHDLDLTTIRHKVLALWGGNKIAETVCGVVLAGKAASASYRFSGRTADFKSLDAMTIEADVLEAAIHVPGAELDLTRAKGPVLIKDSILSGRNLSAQLGNSLGSNAELLLDLANGTNAFTLDIDIDADLQALPPALEQLVHHEGFLHELNKFKEVSGRASGKLHLGDTLHSIITLVDVENMQLRANYDPIPETIIINKGTLHVGPKDVTWQKVNGRIGLQEILSTSGEVSWLTGNTLLHINEIQGQADGKQLYGMLEQTGKLPETIKSKLASLTGKIDLSHGWVKGPAQEPDAWDYQAAVSTKGVSFFSPLLPESATIKDLSATFSNEKVNIQQAKINFLDQSLNLKGILYHQKLENWNGTVEFNGPVQDKLAKWISSRGWFSEKIRPRFPCTLENMRVGFQEQTITVSGKIFPGLAGDRLPMAKIDLENSPEHLLINELTFIAPGEQGSLTLDLQRSVPKSFTISWQGFVNAGTIDKLFNQSAFTQGTFSGAFFEVSSLADNPETLHFKGLLKADNLLLKEIEGRERPIVFENVLLSGTGRQLRIAALNIAIGSEKITGLGHLAAGKKGLLLNIDIISSFISKESLSDLQEGLQKTRQAFIGDHAVEDEGTLSYENWDITGRIGFDFDSYLINRKGTAPFSKTGPVTYTLYDAHGELQLAPGTLTRTEIFSSKLCNIDFKSTWFSDETLGQHLELTNGSNSSLRLENVLPCMGVSQDLIEGEFSLQANLRKESGIWHSGNIHIKSTKGRILRLKTLSRIFKIVNITDLFVTQVSNTGKRGFPFSQMDIDTHIQANNLIFDRAILHGEGLNLFLNGQIHLDKLDTDMTLLIAPFKSFDTLVSKVPIIGKPIMGGYDSLLAFPVAIRGPLPDPLITPLDPKAVSGTLFNIVIETLKLPYNILLQDSNE